MDKKQIREDLTNHILELLDRVRQRVNEDLETIIKEAVDDKYKKQLESEIDINKYVIVKREELEDLKGLVVDLDSRVSSAEDYVTSAETSISDAMYGIGDISDDANSISSSIDDLLVTQEVDDK